MSPVIRIESFPERNGPQIAGVISRYTGMYGVDELLANLPAQFDVEAANFDGLKSELEQLGCNLAEITPTEPIPPPEPTPEEHLLRLFIGKHADSFLGGRNIKTALVVGFFPIPWFFYRKVYLMGVGVLFGLVLVGNIVSAIPYEMVGTLVPIWVAIYLASYGPRWYMWHARRKVRDILQRDLSPEEREALAHKTGGTSVLGAVLGVLIMVSLVALAIMAKQGGMPG